MPVDDEILQHIVTSKISSSRLHLRLALMVGLGQFSSHGAMQLHPVSHRHGGTDQRSSRPAARRQAADGPKGPEPHRTGGKPNSRAVAM